MKKITLGLFMPNPGTSDGAIEFKKSATKTPYFRFTARYSDDDDAVIHCNVFLNAQLVKTSATLPAYLVNQDIYVDEQAFQDSLDNQNDDAAVQALVFTNFAIEPTEEILETQKTVAIELQKDAFKEDKARRDKHKLAFQTALANNQVQNPRFGTRTAPKAGPTGTEPALSGGGTQDVVEPAQQAGG